MFRTANNTVTDWPKWVEKIVEVAQQSLPVAVIGKGQFWPDFWDHPPFAFNLQAAFRGSFGHGP